MIACDVLRFRAAPILSFSMTLAENLEVMIEIYVGAGLALIAELLRDVKIRVVDEAPPERVNDIPSKFLPKFASLEEARAELRSLVRFGMVDAALRRVP